MGRAKFEKRDRNRFRKTYPYMRTRPVMEFMAGKETIMETGALTFTDEPQLSITMFLLFQ